MAITKEKKQEVLQELIDKFGKSKSVVFADYRGLDVVGMSKLRSDLRENGSECKVAKKTLIELAAKESKIDGMTQEIIPGPVAATFSYEDELSGIKVLFNFAKSNENLKLLGGIIDGKVVTADEVNQLAKLPSKDELIAKFMGSIQAPTTNFVGLLSNVMGSLVRVVNAYKDTMSAEGSEATPVEKAEVTEEKTETPAETEEVSAEPASEATEEEKKEEASE